MIELPARAASIHMCHVIVWQNGMVMVFDDSGIQMPDYQGSVEQGILRRIQNVFIGEIETGVWPGSVIYLS